MFALQNSTPLKLVFLGMTTQSLPLGFWILAAVVAGVLTALAVAWLLHIINTWGNAKLQSRIRQLEAEKASYQSQSRESTSSYQSYSYSAASSSAGSAGSASSTVNSNEEWEEEEDDELEDSSYDRSSSNMPSDESDRNYEVKQEPTSSYHSGSVYSYSYKNPSDSAVGKTESVYDAEYRVITPPYRPLDTEEEEYNPESPPSNQQNNNNNDDDDKDWGFVDDEDWDLDDDNDNPRSDKPRS
ncbi:lipopolysaccharide assembly LapA domain-containing protein [Aerosakkonemataceae cyanobacterium BLCC-F154]|uniref:Lipopolysaccharide assembly LapA domain-containing protein n=1 Tax=Floridaenema fluviatile BLCC-F154 TaxID=3153640 RepID=A0ABV4YEH8_9CYAN